MKYQILSAVAGLVLFYIGLKIFASAMKEMRLGGSLLEFLGNPYWCFLLGILLTVLWQSSSLSSAFVVGLVASGSLPLASSLGFILGANCGTTATIWIASTFLSTGLPSGPLRQVSIAHSGFNLIMALSFLPFVHPISRFLSRF